MDERSGLQGDYPGILPDKAATIAGYVKNLVSMATGGRSVGMYLREVLSSRTSFDEALQVFGLVIQTPSLSVLLTPPPPS